MGFLFWFVLRSVIMGVIGNSFYKWFAGTTWGIFFNAKVESILNKVTHREKEIVKFKEAKKAATERFEKMSAERKLQRSDETSDE